MKNVLTLAFVGGLLSVPVGLLFVPASLGYPMAMFGALALHYSHYKLSADEAEEADDDEMRKLIL